MPKRPSGRYGHQPDEQRSDEDVASDRRLRDQEVRPHARREVENGNEPHQTPDAVTNQREPENGRDQSDVGDAAPSHPVGSPSSVTMSCGSSTHASMSSSIRDPPNAGLPHERGANLLGDLVHHEAEHDGRPDHRERLPPRPQQRDERDHDDPVEDPARVVGVSQRLQRPVDQHRADRHPDQAARPAEDDHRVHGDQQDEVEVRREDGALHRREDRTGDARDACAHGEPHQLQAAHGHRHQLGRELVLAKRPPGATGARLIQEVEEGDDEDEGDECDVEVAVERRDLPPEELERVDDPRSRSARATRRR